MKNAFILLMCLALFAPSSTVSAQTDSRGFVLADGFNPNTVLTDDDLFDVSSMSQERLVAFLRSKGGLASVQVTDIDGTVRSAPEIIWRMAQMYQVNPKYLVALLQKEQSLVEDPSPSPSRLDWATGYGVCDACAKDDPAISDFKGFANQIYYAARQMREKYYLTILSTGTTISGVGPGISTVIDGISVTPSNAATAALYTYTPHIHGNMNLWTIWRRWFSKNYPDGTAVKGVPSGSVYWIRFGEKRKFASLAVASSLVDLSKVAEASDSDLSAYPDGAPISFPNYALAQDPEGAIWLIVGNERRHIADMATFKKFGFNIDEVEEATDADLAPYTEGAPITKESMYPQGRLVRTNGDQAIWYAENGTKSRIRHPALLSLYFPGQKPQVIAAVTLNELTETEPYRLHDGELVRTPETAAVYAIEDGKKRAIPSADIFEEMGWKWSSIEVIPASLLDGYAESDPISSDAPVNEPVQLASTE